MAKLDMTRGNGIIVLKAKSISLKAVKEAKTHINFECRVVRITNDVAHFVKGDMVIATLHASKLGARLNMYTKGI